MTRGGHSKKANSSEQKKKETNNTKMCTGRKANPWRTKLYRVRREKGIYIKTTSRNILCHRRRFCKRSSRERPRCPFAIFVISGKMLIC